MPTLFKGKKYITLEELDEHMEIFIEKQGEILRQEIHEIKKKR
jgi:hypothetical protein